MIFISRYLSKAEDKRRDLTEGMALSVALRGKNKDGTYYWGNLTKQELTDLELLKSGTYFEVYKGRDRKIIDKRYKAQKDFNQWILNGNRQARQEALNKLKWGCIITLIIIGFLLLIYYGDQQAKNNPYYWNN